MTAVLSLILSKVLYTGITSKTIIRFEKHALLRMLERGLRFQLSYETTRAYAIQTVLEGRPARKHRSKHKTYCRYFKENLTIYVICEEGKGHHIKTIKTVIIERGRP